MKKLMTVIFLDTHLFLRPSESSTLEDNKLKKPITSHLMKALRLSNSQNLQLVFVEATTSTIDFDSCKKDWGNGCGSNETPTKGVDGNLHGSSIRECDNHDLSRLDNESIERDRLTGIGFVLKFVKFILFTFGEKEMISVIEAVSR
ncbi:hypothetical protein Tco_1345086 [Tanacetum coccineum]